MSLEELEEFKQLYKDMKDEAQATVDKQTQEIQALENECELLHHDKKNLETDVYNLEMKIQTDQIAIHKYEEKISELKAERGKWRLSAETLERQMREKDHMLRRVQEGVKEKEAECEKLNHEVELSNQTLLTVTARVEDLATSYAEARRSIGNTTNTTTPAAQTADTFVDCPSFSVKNYSFDSSSILNSPEQVMNSSMSQQTAPLDAMSAKITGLLVLVSQLTAKVLDAQQELDHVLHASKSQSPPNELFN
eukprot:PhF_6_TR35785/c1_g1_i1/m.52007